MEINELKKLVRFMKKNGIVEYEAAGVKLKLADIPEKTPTKRRAKVETDPIQNDPTAQMPADGDMLFWSSSAFDLTTETRKDDTPVRK